MTERKVSLVVRLLAATVSVSLVAAVVVSGCRQVPPPDVTTFTAGDGLEHRPGFEGEVRTVTVTGPDGEPLRIVYEIVDDLAVAGGDMILGLASEFEGLGEDHEIVLTPESNKMSAHCLWFLVTIWCKGRLWPDATVPYTFADDWGADNATMRARIVTAMGLIEAVTAVRFVPRSGQEDYVRFRNSDGCSSWVGRDGGRQNVNLSVRCGTGAVVHEILHALGLLHEHQRSDRNAFVQILWDNIQSSMKHNFFQEERSYDIGSYDYDSIMHYHGSAFCRETSTGDCVGATILTVPPGTTIGRDVLSAGDISALNRLYPGQPPTITITSPSSSSSFSRGATNVFFQATVVDPEAMDVAVRWTSNVSGLLGTGASTTVHTGDMAYGPHVVTARAEDPQGNVATATVNLTIANDPPTVTIYEPLAGAYCTGESLTFRAFVIDVNEAGATLPDGRVAWRVGSADLFATGKTVTRSFASAGSYQVIVRATDTLGLFDEDWVSLSIGSCTNQPPVVSISVPPTDVSSIYDGSDGTGRWYKDVTFVGSAVDPEDGNLSGASLVWTTDQTAIQPAVLGTGTIVPVRLYSNVCEGVVHTITLTATDADGNVRLLTRRVTIWTIC
jgi:hypothetical protein